MNNPAAAEYTTCTDCPTPDACLRPPRSHCVRVNRGDGAWVPIWNLASVVHEVRNALVPARHHLQRAIADGVTQEDRLRSALVGVERILTMASEIVHQQEGM